MWLHGDSKTKFNNRSSHSADGYLLRHVMENWQRCRMCVMLLQHVVVFSDDPARLHVQLYNRFKAPLAHVASTWAELGKRKERSKEQKKFAEQRTCNGSQSRWVCKPLLFLLPATRMCVFAMIHSGRASICPMSVSKTGTLTVQTLVTLTNDLPTHLTVITQTHMVWNLQNLQICLFCVRTSEADGSSMRCPLVVAGGGCLVLKNIGSFALTNSNLNPFILMNSQIWVWSEHYNVARLYLRNIRQSLTLADPEVNVLR